ncbi:MAG: phosphoglycerate mutase family protein [Cohaesibacter sp.]|jgi:broad specificity phosphatase PhoE|nr:phosphoglycerate mutase family protein [Cohaesibacter sp.]
MLVRYLTHPQVQIEPYIPVPQWELSDKGRSRIEAVVATDWLLGTTHIFSSDETKVLQTARPMAEGLRLPVTVRPDMGEIDRSSTGFLLPEHFEEMVRLFFFHPDQSIRGWESAKDAQLRIVGAFHQAIAEVKAKAVMGDVLLVGHGAVGTLLYCHLMGLPIDHRFSQPEGGGNYLTMDWTEQRVLHSWLPMEEGF